MFRFVGHAFLIFSLSDFFFGGWSDGSYSILAMLCQAGLDHPPALGNSFVVSERFYLY